MSILTKCLLVALGGAIGSAMRFLAMHAIYKVMPAFAAIFPLGTLAVNVIGSLMMGFAVGFLSHASPPSALFIFLTTGVLGGFTTFSAFSLDIITMLQKGDIIPALIYISLSALLSILAIALSIWATRSFI